MQQWMDRAALQRPPLTARAAASRGRSTPSSFVTAISRPTRATSLKPRRPNDHATVPPLSTSHYLYLPCTYTLMSQLLNGGAAPHGLRVCELGAGLGVCSSLLSQLEPPPSRLLATDGDERVMPLLRANLAANATPRAHPRRRLRAGVAKLDADVVVASVSSTAMLGEARGRSAMPSSRRPRRCSRTTGGPSCRSSRATGWRAAHCSVGSWRPRRRPALSASSGVSGASTARCGLSGRRTRTCSVQVGLERE